MVEPMRLRGGQPVRGKVPRNGRASKKRYVLFGALLFLFLAGSIAAVVGYQASDARYRAGLSLAQTGKQHLQRAETLLAGLPHNPFDAGSVDQAQQEFVSARAAFVQVDADLKSLPGISTSVPVYGARLSAAFRLVPLAIDLSEAGVVGCTILSLLISRIHAPLSTQGSGLTMADLGVLGKDLRQVKATLSVVTDRINHLQPEDLRLDPGIARFVAAFHRGLPTLQEWLDNAQQLLVVAPALLGIGTPASYLIEVQDTTELRPGGGFIGNYGIATFSGGRLQAARITDVDLLDKPFEFAGGSIPYPSAYTWFDIGGSSWSFRDSNLDADFPTAARYGELTYKEEGGKTPVQGVIAITPGLIAQALKITGPVYVPEYHETVTAGNLIDRIHYYQLVAPGGSDLVPSPDGHSSLRKRFTELLAEHFLARIRQLSPAAVAGLLRVVLNSLRSKDLQIYFNSSTAQSLLGRYHLDAAIQSPPGDGLFVVDANIGVNKANNLMTDVLYDQVTIDAQGRALHRTTLSYAWMTKGEPVGGSPLYRDYVRIYAPPGSLLQMQDGWEPRGTSQAFNREVWAGFFTLSFGQTRTITLVWTAPGAAKKDAQGWHYRYLIQRQAGVQWTVHLRMTPPSCAAKISTQGGLALVRGTRQAVALSRPLNEDMDVGLDYTC